MLAMNLRAPRGVRFPASSLTTIASKLAPTGIGLMSRHLRHKLRRQQMLEQRTVSENATALAVELRRRHAGTAGVAQTRIDRDVALPDFFRILVAQHPQGK